MTTASLADIRSRLYEAYASQHAGTGDGDATALIYRRDLRPLLPPPAAGPAHYAAVTATDLLEHPIFAACRAAES